MLLAGLIPSTPTAAQTEPPIPSGDIRIHYYRPDGIYTGWTMYAFFDTTEPNNFLGGRSGFRVPIAGAFISMLAAQLARLTLASSFITATPRIQDPTSPSVQPHKVTSSGGKSPGMTTFLPISPFQALGDKTLRFLRIMLAFTTTGQTATMTIGFSMSMAPQPIPRATSASRTTPILATTVTGHTLTLGSYPGILALSFTTASLAQKILDRSSICCSTVFHSSHSYRSCCASQVSTCSLRSPEHQLSRPSASPASARTPCRVQVETPASG